MESDTRDEGHQYLSSSYQYRLAHWTPPRQWNGMCCIIGPRMSGKTTFTSSIVSQIKEDFQHGVSIEFASSSPHHQINDHVKGFTSVVSIELANIAEMVEKYVLAPSPPPPSSSSSTTFIAAAFTAEKEKDEKEKEKKTIKEGVVTTTAPSRIISLCEIICNETKNKEEEEEDAIKNNNTTTATNNVATNNHNKMHNILVKCLCCPKARATPPSTPLPRQLVLVPFQSLEDAPRPVVKSLGSIVVVLTQPNVEQVEFMYKTLIANHSTKYYPEMKFPTFCSLVMNLKRGEALVICKEKAEKEEEEEVKREKAEEGEEEEEEEECENNNCCYQVLFYFYTFVSNEERRDQQLGVGDAGGADGAAETKIPAWSSW